MTVHWRRALGALLWAASVTAGAAPVFTVVPAQSSLSFIGTQQGEKFTGVIRDFDARIAYASSDLASSRLEVAMRLKSIDTKSPDRDQAIATTDWFDVAKYPVATFRTLSIRATPTGPVGEAELTIKGHTQRLAFPFSWKATPDGGATLDARVTLDRLDFGLGTGEWADESMVGRKVEVVVHLALAASAAAPVAPAKPPTTKPAHP